jgi:glutathione synthase/RimK-type ligase-like ATP-grasp enzyme
MEKGGKLMKKAARNKWLKYLFMKKSKRLSPYLPETRIMAQDALWNLIKKYENVIVKPVKGSRGSGVIQVSSIGDNKYELHFENKVTTIQGEENTYQYLKSKIGAKSYIVQRTISRPTVDGRPFDMRVIVQRKSNSDLWKVTAKVAKVAGKGYIVSNISRSKGTLLLVETAIQKSSIKHLSTKTLESQIDRVALLSAKTLGANFKNHRIYGLDIGLDQNGQVWIIEANLFPLMSHFLKLKDKTMYRRIMAYKKASTNDSYKLAPNVVVPLEFED